MYKVTVKDGYPKKKIKVIGRFKKRQQARQRCRNHSWEEDMKIHHPDGNVEDFKWDSEV